MDELIVDDQLQTAFLSACADQLPEIKPWRFNWTLLNLRKAGKLSDVPTTQFRRDNVADVRVIAEIAARSIQDKYDTTVDRILADPDWRRELDEAARQIHAEVNSYAVRKAALQLRKTRQLQPELVTRIANWGREIDVLPFAEIVDDIQRVPPRPGIYIFRDATGYLYIGEADNLRRRLQQHSQKSDRLSLANYLEQIGARDVSVELHTFEEGAPIERLSVRRAYESELIRSRNPRFNVRP